MDAVDGGAAPVQVGYTGITEPVWPQLTHLTPHQRLFLRRLRRLAALRRHCHASSLLEQNLVNRALYSTFRDCQALGVEDEARRLLGVTSIG